MDNDSVVWQLLSSVDIICIRNYSSLAASPDDSTDWSGPAPGPDVDGS